MKILGVMDYETDTPEADTCNVVEVAISLYDLDTKKKISSYSDLIKIKAEFTEDSSYITGLTNEILQEDGINPDKVWKKFFKMVAQCDCLLAHNGLKFDYIILDRYAKKYKKVKTCKKPLRADTRYHVKYHHLIKTRKLLYLCAEAGIMIDGHHRALNDVDANWKLAKHHGLKKLLKRAKEPLITLEAEVKFADKDKAKDAGFYPDYVDGKFQGWFKEGLECDLKEEAKEWDFDTALIEEEPDDTL